jgi:hypothetical protein
MQQKMRNSSVIKVYLFRSRGFVHRPTREFCVRINIPSIVRRNTPDLVFQNHKSRKFANFGFHRSSFVARNISETILIGISILKFTDTLSRLEQATKHKTEFLCRMSHELRYETNCQVKKKN